MNEQKLVAVKRSYKAMREGTGSEEDHQTALDELNGPAVSGEREYYLLMMDGKLIRLEDRITIFSTAFFGQMFSIFCNGGDCLVCVTKRELLEQLSPDTEFVLDPGNSPFTSPGKAMRLAELPA